jgi:hypothetical protein
LDFSANVFNNLINDPQIGKVTKYKWETDSNCHDELLSTLCFAAVSSHLPLTRLVVTLNASKVNVVTLMAWPPHGIEAEPLSKKSKQSFERQFGY